jgi:hypothetical protein
MRQVIGTWARGIAGRRIMPSLQGIRLCQGETLVFLYKRGKMFFAWHGHGVK